MFRADYVHLERKIRIFVLAEVLRMGLGRHSLQGVITESAAMVICRYHTAFLADDTVVIDLSTEGAVNTGSLDLFSEQHDTRSFLTPIIAQLFGNFQPEIAGKSGKPSQEKKSAMEADSLVAVKLFGMRLRQGVL